jgi:NADH-quinone oxidoreductase subunit G
LHLEGFDYESHEDVLKELQAINPEGSCHSRDNSDHTREGSDHTREPSCHSREGGNLFRMDPRLRGDDKVNNAGDDKVNNAGDDKDNNAGDDKVNNAGDAKTREAKNIISRIGDIPLYATDSIVRRGEALQATQVIIEGNLDAARMHPDMAEKLAFQEGDTVFIKQNDVTIQLPVVLDQRVPLHAVAIAGGITSTCGLSELFGSIEVYK